MASDRDQWADNLSGENSGSWLTGFLADEDDFDRRSLWRLGSWGVGTVGVVVVALFANQSTLGWRREQVASTDLVRQSQQIQWIAKESQNETRRLASAIDTLNGDRDRLYSRVTVLEQGLESVTGSIGQQNAAPASPAPAASTAAVAAPSVSPRSASRPPAPAVATSQPPVDSPVTELIGPPSPAAPSPTVSQAGPPPAASPPTVSQTAAPATSAAKAAPSAALTATAGADKPSTVAALQPEPAAASAPPPSPPAPEARSETTNDASSAAITAPPSAAAPLMATKSILAPPDPAAARLLEPTPSDSSLPPLPPPQTIAAAPGMTEPNTADSQAPAVAVQRTEFGIDLGGANSVEGLRALWRSLLKYRSTKGFADLRPIIVVKERSSGLGMQLRLVAGPINDAAAAAKLCAALIEASRPCETTVFDGQRLALKNDNATKADTGAAAPVAAPNGRPTAMRSSRKRGNASGAKIEEPPAETTPPPQKSSLTSLLGLR